MQCVPKKGGIMMVPNEKEEIISIRPVQFGKYVWIIEK